MSARLLPLLLAAVVLTGCRARVMMPMPAATTKATSSSTGSPAGGVVDPTKIEVDREKRLVKLYPIKGRWLVVLPGKPQESVEGLQYRVPDGVNLDAVEFYFVTEGSAPSNAVRLAQVKEMAKKWQHRRRGDVAGGGNQP